MIYLYLKTHNKTGLKYLGKTTLDPFVYKGSGVYWKRHIAKHGYDVTTEILLESDSIEEIKAEGTRLSEEWNIVESDAFANLMEENGIGGKNKGSFVKGCIPHNKGIKGKKSAKISEKRKAYWRRWREENPDYKSKWKSYQRTGRTQEGIEAHQLRAEELNITLITCPHCGKTGNIGNMNRWHLDKCKMKKDD